jgi:hypothetical protein
MALSLAFFAVAVSVRWHLVLAWKKSGGLGSGPSVQALGHDGMGCVVMCGPIATPLTPLPLPLHCSAGFRFRSQGLRQMPAMTAAPKEECKWVPDSLGRKMPRHDSPIDSTRLARFSTPAAQ